MTTQEMIAVITAFEQGKKIESCAIGSNDWNLSLNPIWDFSNWIYRVVEEPEYVPYDGTQEGTLVGKIVRHSNGIMRMIIGESKTSRINNDVILGGQEWWTPYEDLFNHYTFLDGQPCGMLKK